jgi:hypothetical protein
MDVRLKRAACLASLACMAALAWMLAWMTPLAAQEEPAAKLAKRFNFTFEAGLYPQQTPQEALQSIIKALDTKKIDYLLAHLADPRFVDDRIE